MNACRPSFTVALDVERNHVKYGKSLRGFEFIAADGSRLPFRDKAFDLVTCFEVLEHVEKPQDVVRESARCLRPNGHLIVLVPNDRSILFRVIWFLWSRTKGRFWKHLHEFSEQRIRTLLGQAFRIEEVAKSHLGMLIFVKARRK